MMATAMHEEKVLNFPDEKRKHLEDCLFHNDKNARSCSEGDKAEVRDTVVNTNHIPDGFGLPRLRKKSGTRTFKRTHSYSSSVYDEENRKRLLNGDTRPDQPCHHMSESLFSTSSGFQNFRGLLNWCTLMLVFTTGRVALENLMKYGILIDPINWYHIFMKSPTNFPAIWIVLALGCFVLVAFFIEKLAASMKCSEGLITFLHCSNLLTEITLPAVLVYYFHPHPFVSSPLLGLCVVVFLKLASYAQVNKWCRINLQKSSILRMNRSKSRKSVAVGVVLHESSRCGTGGSDFAIFTRSRDCTGSCNTTGHRCSSHSIRTYNSIEDHELKAQPKKTEMNDPRMYMMNYEFQEYPDNLNLKDMGYYMLVPTVCYELNFPRTTRIRKRFLLTRAVESLFLWGLMLSLIQQWIYPTVENSLEMFQQMNYAMMVDRILKLAIPNHLIWLMGFYWSFHSCFNLIAELLRFGDRTFYKDWWNAENLQQFWSTWNVPIHRFALRHIYKPMLSKGVHKGLANMIVFLVSAFFHEYLCSIPLRMFRPWFFVSFALQVPLVLLSSRITGKFGNILMWMMLILGQPVAILMYFHDYYIANRI